MATRTFEEIIQRACELGPFADAAAATSSFLAVLRVISLGLLPEERQALAEALPAEARQVLQHREPARPLDVDGLVEHTAVAEGTGLGRALEHLQIAGRVLLEALPPPERTRLTRAVPELARLLEVRDDAEPVLPTSEWPEGGAHDLAEGRAGGRHPLATSDPSRVAHRHSIARSDDPHGDSKLSGARGLTQERDGDTLASGQPGSKRPLSSSH